MWAPMNMTSHESQLLTLKTTHSPLIFKSCCSFVHMMSTYTYTWLFIIPYTVNTLEWRKGLENANYRWKEALSKVIYIYIYIYQANNPFLPIPARWVFEIGCWGRYLGLQGGEGEESGEDYSTSCLLICTTHQIWFGWSHQEEWDKHGMYRQEEKCIQDFGGQTWGTETLGRLGVAERTTLKSIFKKSDWGHGLD